MTKYKILKIAEIYDLYYRGGTGRGLIDDELATLLAWAEKNNAPMKEVKKRLIFLNKQ